MDLPSPSSSLCYRWDTPSAPGRSAAIAVIHVQGDPQEVFTRLSIHPFRSNTAVLRNVGGIDWCVCGRTESDSVFITPHAGAGIHRRLSEWLASLGVIPCNLARTVLEYTGPLLQPQQSRSHHDGIAFPEASTPMEAAMLRVLSMAASPLAIDLLLDQPRRWMQFSIDSPVDFARLSDEQQAEVRVRSIALKRLVCPPCVVAVGLPNVGKSTLLNVLARRSVAIVADEPGTTRDHVGVQLNLGGLVVNFIDTPGINDSPISTIDHDAQLLGIDVARRSDLLVVCHDAGAAFPQRLVDIAREHPRTLTVRLRCDLQPLRSDVGAELCISARTGEGLDSLTTSIREVLVPRAVTDHPGPWRFW